MELVPIKELRERSVDELINLEKELRAKLHEYKFKKALGQTNSTHESKAYKKQIARILTIINDSQKSKEN